MQIVFFTRPESVSYASTELSSLGFHVTALSREVGLAEGEGDVETIVNGAPLFVRHIHPVESCHGSFDEVVAWTAENARRIEGKKLAVQVYDATGARLDAHLRYSILDHPAFAGVDSGPEGECVLSATITQKGVLVGFSSPTENLTPRTAGIYRYGFEKSSLSRAEFKLIEVFDTLPIVLPSSFRAIDLGAAPGGWTRVLLNRGALVTAVDPAMLDESLEQDNRVTHYKGLSQEYLKERGQTDNFDLLVNDMRMNARHSVRVTQEAMEMLPVGAWVIMTLKLPEKKSLSAAREAIALFREKAELVYARQLYHNRSEITVVGRKRESPIGE